MFWLIDVAFIKELLVEEGNMFGCFTIEVVVGDGTVLSLCFPMKSRAVWVYSLFFASYLHIQNTAVVNGQIH